MPTSIFSVLHFDKISILSLNAENLPQILWSSFYWEVGSVPPSLETVFIDLWLFWLIEFYWGDSAGPCVTSAWFFRNIIYWNTVTCEAFLLISHLPYCEIQAGLRDPGCRTPVEIPTSAPSWLWGLSPSHLHESSWMSSFGEFQMSHILAIMLL